MNKIVIYLIFFIIISNCSLDTKSGLWSEKKKINKDKEKIVRKIFDKSSALEKEFNSNIKIKLNDNFKKNSFINNLTNNNGYLDFNGNFKEISKYKFSKIKQFQFVQPEILFTQQKNIIFFENKGNILKFDNKSNLIWEKNFYNKKDRKLDPILFFATDHKNLIVADNISNYFSVDITTGNLLWMKSNISPFNSEIKIYKDKFFVIDFENTLHCYSIKDGRELWNFKTEKTFIKSQQKLSLIIDKKKVIFINNIGDVTALDLSGNLIWQTPTQSNDVYENAFSLKNSDLIIDNDLIYFSNNKNELFALSSRNGSILWKQNVNSNLRPTIINKLLFTVSIEGFLVIIDSIKGNIIRATNIFDQIKKNKKKNIKPTGFIVAKNKVYISLNNGKLLFINLINGKSENIIKIDSDNISRPFVLDNTMYIVRNNAILKIN